MGLVLEVVVAARGLLLVCWWRGSVINFCWLSPAVWIRQEVRKRKGETR